MRVAVLSDIHSNLRALDAVLASLGTVDAVWHLGDVVGYGPEPSGVIERLREIGAVGVKGNHDDAATGGESILHFNADAREAIDWTRERLPEPDLAYLANLPLRLQPLDSAFTLVHGSPREPIWEYVDAPAIARDNLAALETPYCLVGHTHIPFVFRQKGSVKQANVIQLLAVEPGGLLHLDERRALINPGSVGQPRDGDPRASYLVLDTETAEARWDRVDYDIEDTAADMLQVGLPSRLAQRLFFGR
jgi:predicted phosphodiesterase